MKVLGVDPGVAYLGFCCVELLPVGERVHGVWVVKTEPSRAKRHLRAADDLSERLQLLAHHLHQAIEPETVAICVEEKAIPFRNGRMLLKPSGISALGRIRGVIDGLACVHGLPILEETAQRLKAAATGRKTAAKQDVIRALESRYPELADMWPRQMTYREHAADSVAAVVACLNSPMLAGVRKVATVRRPNRVADGRIFTDVRV